jgi:hypothetical protein
MAAHADNQTMDTALRESLISHVELRRAGMIIRALPDGSVASAYGDRDLGTWRWENGAYTFRRPGRTTVEIEVATLYGVIVYLATLIDVELIQATNASDQQVVA